MRISIYGLLETLTNLNKLINKSKKKEVCYMLTFMFSCFPAAMNR